MNLTRKYLPILYGAIVIFITALIQSCDIKEPTAPNWDVTLNIPIANKSYTMIDIIEKKSSLIEHYPGGINQNLLYYSENKQMDKITLGDKLKPDPYTSITPGAISISADSVVTEIGFSWISSSATPGMQIVIPVVPEKDVSGNFSLADQFQTITIESGFIDIEITNYFPSPVKITLSNIVLKNFGTGEIVAQLSTPIEIPPLQTVTRKSIPIVHGIKVKNQLTLESKISSTGSNGQQITLPSKSLTIKAKFHDLKVSEYTGQLKPTTFEKTRTTLGLDLKDIQNKLHFQQINLRNPKIELHLRLTANVEFKIDGTIEARNSIGQKSVMTLSSRTMDKIIISQTDSVITFNADSVSNFFKNFSQFPDSLIVYVGGTANPNNKTISLNGSDQLIVSSKIELPFEFGLIGGEFYDSVKVDFNNDDRDKIKNVNSLGASLTVTNGIPASISFTAKLYDQNNNFLTYFPPKYQDQDTVITVNGSIVDLSGNVISSSAQNLTVKSLKTEIDKISNAAYMRVRIKFNTSGGGQAVKFKTDNTIKFNASGSTNYHVNPKEDKK